MFTLESNDGCAVFASAKERMRITFATASIAHITFTGDKPFRTRPSLIVTNRGTFSGYELQESGGDVTLATPALKLIVSKTSGAIRYLDAAGNLLLAEPQRGGKWLTPKTITRNIFRQGAQITGGQSIDGARAIVADFETVFDREAFEAKLEFVFSKNEALFGLGSHEEGYGNLRGKSRELYQQNMKAVVPYFVSTQGYGLLLDCASLMTFHDDALGSYWWADAVDELDYYFIHGATFDEVTRGYHALTGSAPMLPKWAFGYVQSKERYVTAREIVDVVCEYRRRKIPLDLIVLDWKSWPNGAGWGQKSFDPARFPDPPALACALHEMGAKLMVSIWPIMTGDCPDQSELRVRGLMLGNQSTYDAFSEEARAVYWEQANRGLFANGVDAWWCDCTEPFEADWSGAVKPQPHSRLSINIEASKKYLDHGLLNGYSLLHSQGIYEGQRAVTSAKRVVNLTRSSYAGQHRYGTVTWSGDICGTWEALRRCIPEGVNFCVTGEPYWTVDIGGFFINHDTALWFWRGDYSQGCRGLTDMNALAPDPQDTGCRDLGFHELYTRWLQYGVFLPMFRSHGTDAPREIWRFGEPGNPFYDTIAEYIRLRYRFIPYIYSAAAQVTRDSRTLMRAVALDFPQDAATHELTDQYLFGPSLLVCPVTVPMYYGPNSVPIAGADKARDVVLPEGAHWYDFWTECEHQGGQQIRTPAPLGTIPLFVRAGSILPMSPVMQFADEIPDAAYEIRIYRGADAEFSIYEDAGDGYDYESGGCALVNLKWDDARDELRIAPRAGSFPGMVAEREYHLVFISAARRETKTILYTGAEIKIATR